MYKFLVPDFLLDFNCIGTQCEETCCKEWDITVDKNTFYSYKKSKNILIRNLCKKNISLIEKNSHDLSYAKIVLDEEKICPFLDNNKLCSIHGELGHNSLCYTCKVYPRVFNKIGGFFEASLFLSCPEVVRLALFNKEKMSFSEVNIDYSYKIYGKANINKNNDIYWSVREFAIDILQNRSFKLWERLAILGVFFEKSSAYIENGEKNELISIMDSFNMILNTDEVHNILDIYDKNTNIQLDLTKVINKLRNIRINNETFKGIVTDFNNGLVDNSESKLDIVAKYNENYETYYKDYIKDHEHILENYLVHYVFTNVFPYSTKHNPYDTYFILALNYVLIRTYLIGISGVHKKIDDEQVVNLIQSYSRVYSHGSTVIQTIYEYFKNKKIMTLENLILLIKE